jgi:hypothetical protein
MVVRIMANLALIAFDVHDDNAVHYEGIAKDY